MSGEHFTLAVFEAAKDLQVDEQAKYDKMFEFELKMSENTLYIMIWYKLIDKEYLEEKYKEQNFHLLYYTLKNTRILTDIKKIQVANLIFVAKPSLLPNVIEMCRYLTQKNELQYPLIEDLDLTTIDAQVLYFLHKATMNTEISRYFRIILTEKDYQQKFIDEYSLEMKCVDVLMLPEKFDSETENEYKPILESFDILFDSIQGKFDRNDKVTIYSYFKNPIDDEKHKFINIYAYIDSPINEKEVKDKKHHKAETSSTKPINNNAKEKEDKDKEIPSAKTYSTKPINYKAKEKKVKDKKSPEAETNSTKSFDSSVNENVNNIINRFYKIRNQIVYFVLREQKREKMIDKETQTIYIEKAKIQQIMKILPYFNSDDRILIDISNYGKHLKISFKANSKQGSLLDYTNKYEMERYEFGGFPKGMESKLLRMLSLYGANMIFWDEKTEKYIVYAPSTYDISEVFKNNITQNFSSAPSIAQSTTDSTIPRYSNS